MASYWVGDQLVPQVSLNKTSWDSGASPVLINSCSKKFFFSTHWLASKAGSGQTGQCLPLAVTNVKDVDISFQQCFHNVVRENSGNNRSDLVTSKTTLQYKPIRLGDYRHYVFNANYHITAAQLNNAAELVFGPGQYRVKRIIKPLSRYTRLSVLATLDDCVTAQGVASIATSLEAKSKLLSLRRNTKMEAKSKASVSHGSVLTLNINGISEKYHELLCMLQRYKPDIVCLQETKRRLLGKRLHINGYSITEVSANNGGLGLAMGVRIASGITLRTLTSASHYMLAAASGLGREVVIGNIYCSSQPAVAKQTLQSVSELLKTHARKACLLVGDWNKTPATIVKRFRTLGVNVVASHAPTKGTRLNKHLRRTPRPIDFGVSTCSSLITSQKVRKGWLISDHCPVEIIMSSCLLNVASKKVTRLDRGRLCDPVTAKAVTDYPYTDSVDQFHKEIAARLRTLGIITEMEYHPNKIYVPTKIKAAVSKKRAIGQLAKLGRIHMDALRIASTEVKRQVRKYKRKKYLQYIRQGIEALANNDARKAWGWIQSHLGPNRRAMDLSQVYKPGSSVVVSELDKRLDIWADYFASLSKKELDCERPSLPTVHNSDISNITDAAITWREITTVLKRLRKGKASGYDMIPGEVYKLVENEQEPTSGLARCIISIMNKVFLGNTFPETWMDCVIVPIFKKGDKLDPNNYRGIALINTLLKVLTKVVADRLQVVCSQADIIRREQAGFMAGEECPTQVACLLESCQRRKILGLDTVLCFLDLRKAYDLVPHERLFDKLAAAGLGQTMIGFIRRMYANTHMRVRIDNACSRPYKYDRGVRQGCPTSPLLFNIYINDILNNTQPVPIPGLEHGLRGLMFADDTVIIAESHRDLVSKLDGIHTWMADNAMEINPSKCGVMLITSSESPLDAVHYNGETFPMVDKYVYLGVEFNNKLDILQMSKHRLDKGKQALAALSTTLSNTRVPLAYKRMLIQSVLIPTLHYGAEIFGMCEARMNSLKRVLDNSIKTVLKKSNYCRLRAYDEFDVLPLYVSAAVSRARGLYKWINSNTPLSDLMDPQGGFKSKKSTWIKESRRWLKVMGVNLAQPFRDIKSQLVSNRLTRLHERSRSVIGNWAHDNAIGSGAMLRKAEIARGCNPIGVNAILRMRTGTFRFTKELVILQRLPEYHRNRCACCGLNVVENVQHLLLQCPALSELRGRLLPCIANQPAPSNQQAFFTSWISRLLGGEWPAAGQQPSRELLECIEFLSAAIPRRQALIRSRRG